MRRRNPSASAAATAEVARELSPAEDAEATAFLAAEAAGDLEPVLEPSTLGLAPALPAALLERAGGSKGSCCIMRSKLLILRPKEGACGW